MYDLLRSDNLNAQIAMCADILLLQMAIELQIL